MKFVNGWVALLGLILVLGLPTWAQETSVFNGKVYAPVPSYAYARIPAGGLSRFYGSVQVGAPRNEEVRVHLYWWPLAGSTLVEASEKERAIARSYRLDVFVRKLRKKARFHLVQSFDIPLQVARDLGFSIQTVSFSVQWLNPKTRQTPMLLLNLQNNGFYGPYGHDIALVFAGGWTKKPALQAFVFHGDHYEAVRSEFSSLDENGNVQIARIAEANDVDPGVVNWKWNGKKFATNEDKPRSWDAPVEN